jgi:hypothetical protein
MKKDKWDYIMEDIGPWVLVLILVVFFFFCIFANTPAHAKGGAGGGGGRSVSVSRSVSTSKPSIPKPPPSASIPKPTPKPSPSSSITSLATGAAVGAVISHSTPSWAKPAEATAKAVLKLGKRASGDYSPSGIIDSKYRYDKFNY